MFVRADQDEIEYQSYMYTRTVVSGQSIKDVRETRAFEEAPPPRFRGVIVL